MQFSTYVVHSLFNVFCIAEQELRKTADRERPWHAEGQDPPDASHRPDPDALELYEWVMRRLSERERFVLVLRSEGVTLRQIGELLGVTGECVRQVEQAATERVRRLHADRV